MNIKTIHLSFIVVVSLIQAIACRGQQARSDSIEGSWKGTSLCQPKPSPCHDETVVYHISKNTKEKTYTIQMKKVVNGAEEEMGFIDVVYDEQRQTLTGETKNSKAVLISGFSGSAEEIHGPS